MKAIVAFFMLAVLLPSTDVFAQTPPVYQPYVEYCGLGMADRFSDAIVVAEIRGIEESGYLGRTRPIRVLASLKGPFRRDESTSATLSAFPLPKNPAPEFRLVHRAKDSERATLPLADRYLIFLTRDRRSISDSRASNETEDSAPPRGVDIVVGWSNTGCAGSIVPLHRDTNLALAEGKKPKEAVRALLDDSLHRRREELEMFERTTELLKEENLLER